jgi:transportin-1
LQEFHKYPDYNNYLIYIFTKLENTPANENIRTSAGLLVKNNIKQYYHQLDDGVRAYIKREVLVCLGDASETVRSTTGGIVSEIVRQAGLDQWPGLLESLVGALTSSHTEPRLIEGILSALSKVCEDSAYHMCMSEQQGGPEKYEAALNVLIPLFIQFLVHEVPSFRRYALISINQFITPMPRAFGNHFPEFLTVSSLVDLSLFDWTDPVIASLCVSL